MTDKSKWTAMSGYIEGTALKPIGTLHQHSTIPGRWIGTMGDRVIVIHEAHTEDGRPSLLLFENPAATLRRWDGEDQGEK